MYTAVHWTYFGTSRSFDCKLKSEDLTIRRCGLESLRREVSQLNFWRKW